MRQITRQFALLLAILALIGVNSAFAQVPGPPIMPGELQDRQLTLDASIRFALANNPQLAALRQQHGIAAGAVVIAQTYPFNPIYQGTIKYAQGPDSSVVENHLSSSHQVTLEVQLFNQQRYRQQGAFASLK